MFYSPPNWILIISRPLASHSVRVHTKAIAQSTATRRRTVGQVRLIRTSKDSNISSNSKSPVITTGSDLVCLDNINIPAIPTFHSHTHISLDQHPEPCSSASGPFSSSISGTTTTSGRTIPTTNNHNNKNPTLTLTGNRYTCIARTGQGVHTAFPASNTNNSFFSGLHRPYPKRQMAFNAYSTPSSDISTPRSSSPAASAFSGRSSHSTVSSKRLSLSLSRRQSAFNPMSSIDIHAIEEQMKMAALDGLRGYAQDHYAEVEQYKSTEYVSQAAATGYQVLREPLWNKGNSFFPPYPHKYKWYSPVWRFDANSDLKASHSLPMSVSPRT